MLEVKVGLHLIPRLPFRFEFKSLLKGEDYGGSLGLAIRLQAWKVADCGSIPINTLQGIKNIINRFY